MSKFNLKYNTKTVLYLLAFVYTHVTTMEQLGIKSKSNYLPLLIMDDSLLILYKGSYQALPFYINKKELPSSYMGLKTLFAKNNLVTYNYPVDWTDSIWEKTYVCLRDQSIEESHMIDFNKLPALLGDAKRIVKSLLLDNDNKISCAINGFIQKSLDDRLNRLFTYAYLQQVIDARNLAHVRLPRKILLIQDKTTKQCLSNKEAQKVIDNTLKIYVYSGPVSKLKIDDTLKIYVYPGQVSKLKKEVNLAIKFHSDQYELKFFAHKESSIGNGLSAKAFADLVTLCKEAPFDIGYDNIFWNERGDAVIIDTEYKGEQSSTACPKLGRYLIDQSL